MLSNLRARWSVVLSFGVLAGAAVWACSGGSNEATPSGPPGTENPDASENPGNTSDSGVGRDGGQSLIVQVTTTGLVGSGPVVLQNNGGDNLSITGNGVSAFSGRIAAGGAYDVTVLTQPPGGNQRCETGGGKGSAVGQVNVTLTCSSAWRYHRAITLTNDGTARANEPVMIVLEPGSFNFANVASGGKDIRFSTSAALADSLPYYIETWRGVDLPPPGPATDGGVGEAGANDSGTDAAPDGGSADASSDAQTDAGDGGARREATVLWVRVPSVAAGTSTIHMFYGNASAAEASSFAATFPGATFVTASGTLTGDVSTEWFQVQPGVTLALGGSPLADAGLPPANDAGVRPTPRIQARRILILGAIDGDGAGEDPSGTSGGTGNGAGGGTGSTNAGAGGGSYGGTGGTGGLDTGDAPGIGGASHGTATGSDLSRGSAGGNGSASPGGKGGGALMLQGWRTTVRGSVSVSGGIGANGGQCGGGGSGGGLLVSGSRIELSLGLVRAQGGAGGPGTSSANDSGGGGGGGRIKIFGRTHVDGTPDVAGGLGGPNGTAAPGGPGGAGSVHSTSAATPVEAPGITYALGAETTQ